MFKLFNESCNLILIDGFMNSHIMDGGDSQTWFRGNICPFIIII